ncbi:carbonate dehydratase [Motiliproteus sp. MSK22-1]|uniref:carbonate dehydratase n=1 Tax=Motiliproteus sp. MSK22-1 TaxID=1897630 RepID=UPI0009767B1D|nr:carbonate dehydratase [Motiliproteus sp. MSK22-1]OMH32822.1 carbonic anhydrase [Motiliproteus sp. MSK22-1]
MEIDQKLFKRNREWAEKVRKEDPDFFKRLSGQQKPEFLWIGCSDSRVPANQIVALEPGEVFVHRNIANVVVHSDLNCMSVIQYAVEVLEVKHIIVCGHYGCGGVSAALGNQQFGLIDSWLRHIKDVYRLHRNKIDSCKSDKERQNLLCELNVIEQVANVSHTTIVQNAWKKGQELAIHGWVYGIDDGILHDLSVCVNNPYKIEPIFRM